MIVCDRDHLGLLDVVARRNAFGRQLASFEADLESTGSGPEPLRAVFIRAPWIESAGDGVEVLAEVDGHPVAVREGNVLACSFHPELTDDSRVHALLMAMATAASTARSGAPAATERRPVRDPRVTNLAKILVSYSTKVGEGDTCLIEGPTAAEPLIAAVYEEVLKAGRQPGRSRSPSRARRRVFLDRPPTPSSSGSRRCRSGRPRRPTAGSRSAPTRTRASSRRSRPSARRAARRRPGS